MADLNLYLEKRGITRDQMNDACARTRAVIDAYNLREARKANHMTQMELAAVMGVSQNRISRMENGDIATMSIETIRRYIEALGGKMSLTAELPNGHISLI